MDNQSVITDRLRRFYSDTELENIFEFDSSKLDPSNWPVEPQPDHKASVFRGESYDIGRIRWFYENGIPDPISIDNECFHSRIMPVPLLLDGHHRFWAAVLRGDRTIQATYGGRLDLLEWLTGVRDELPED